MNQHIKALTMRQFLMAALTAWHDLAYFIPHSDDLHLVKQAIYKLPEESSYHQNQTIRLVVAECLDELKEVYSEGYHILRLRFLEGFSVHETALQQQLAPDQVKYRQKKALRRLTQIACRHENQLRDNQVEYLLAKIPMQTYSSLFGAAVACKELRDAMLADDGGSLIFIVGIGGIGKTAVCREVVARVLTFNRFEVVHWLSNKRGHFTTSINNVPTELTPNSIVNLLYSRHISAESQTPRMSEKRAHLKQLLRNSRTLLVIDNFEFTPDSGQIIAELQDLANPLHIIITTRTNPEPRPGLFIYQLEQLNLQSAIGLIRDCAKITSNRALLEASDEQLALIYNAVGGHPLAIKLIVNLASTFSFKNIIANLVDVQNREIEKMYCDIYEQIWDGLSDPARTLMLAISKESGSEFTRKALREITSLSELQLSSAINQLKKSGLLMVTGTPFEGYHYSTHLLTKNFVVSSLAK